MIRFSLAGDQDARPLPGESKPYWNNFEVWKRIRRQNNDFNVLMGDTIYSDTEVPGYGLDDVAVSVKQKWDAYKTNLKQEPWAQTRGSAAYYAHWDDHEFINDFSQQENSFPYSNDGVDQGSTNIDGKKLYKNGVKAFEDYNPTTYSKKTGIYRFRALGQEPGDLLPRRALVPQCQRRLRRHLRQLRREAATPTSRRPRRRARATPSPRSPRSSPARRPPAATRRSTTQTGRCSAPSSSTPSSRRSRSRRRPSR